MEKKSYLRDKFLRDFLRYSLLQEDSMTAEQLASRMAMAVDVRSLAESLEEAIDALLERHLAFEKFKQDGELAEVLPEHFSPALCDRMVAEYEEVLALLNPERAVATIYNDLVACVERKAWSNGIREMAEAVQLLTQKIAAMAESYRAVPAQEPSSEELEAKYRAARENTLLERLQGSNLDDVVEYRSLMQEYVRTRCENRLHNHLAYICDQLVAVEGFAQMQSQFVALVEEAEQMRASLCNMEPDAALDKEYNRLVPTDFYHRNVEHFTAEQAFQMVLFQFFAKHEEWMIERGMLVDGELRVFVGDAVNNIKSLLSEMLFAD